MSNFKEKFVNLGPKDAPTLRVEKDAPNPHISRSSNNAACGEGAHSTFKFGTEAGIAEVRDYFDANGNYEGHALKVPGMNVESTLPPGFHVSPPTKIR